MGRIVVYNCHEEDHTCDKNGVNFYIGRLKSGNPLANPYTFNGKRSDIAKMSFKTREEAIEAYKVYFDKMYGVDPNLTKAFDKIYEHFKKGDNIFLQCFCKPCACHGDYLAEMLQRKLVKEKIAEMRAAKQNVGGKKDENQQEEN